MAIKTTVEARGVLSEEATKGTIDIVTPRKYVYSETSVSAGDTEYVVLAPATAAGLTGSLPAISSAILGKMYTIATGNTNPVLVSGSNNISSGSTGFTHTISTHFGSLTVMAMSSSGGGLFWQKLNSI